MVREAVAIATEHSICLNSPGRGLALGLPVSRPNSWPGLRGRPRNMIDAKSKRMLVLEQSTLKVWFIQYPVSRGLCIVRNQKRLSASAGASEGGGTSCGVFVSIDETCQ